MRRSHNRPRFALSNHKAPDFSDLHAPIEVCVLTSLHQLADVAYVWQQQQFGLALDLLRPKANRWHDAFEVHVQSPKYKSDFHTLTQLFMPVYQDIVIGIFQMLPPQEAEKRTIARDLLFVEVAKPASDFSAHFQLHKSVLCLSSIGNRVIQV